MKLLIASDIHGSAYYCRLLLEAENEFECSLPEYRMMVRAKLIEILTSLVRSGKYQQKNETAAKSMTAISEAVEYIHKNLTTELRLCAASGKEAQ